MRETVKYLTRDLFIELNDKAIRGKMNRTLRANAIKERLEDIKYPVVSVFMSDETVARCNIAVNSRGTEVQLDMLVDDYNPLPTIDLKGRYRGRVYTPVN